MAGKIIVGVMGPGENATPDDNEMAFELGKAIAKEGWAVLTNSRHGTATAVHRGYREPGFAWRRLSPRGSPRTDRRSAPYPRG